MSLNISKAKRELIWTKIALMGPSGSGKSYSALRMATGMKQELAKLGIDTRILLVSTEQARGRYYANEFDYDIVDVDSPHEPEKYVKLINDIVAEGNHLIVVMDSTSHEWEGRGGCLELHQQAGGTYQSWAKVTPRHDKFIIAIADSPLHIIAAMRGKDQYEMEKSDTGKVTVKKLGMGAKQREGFEYEFTATFLLDQKTNLASVQKDNTHLFEKEGDMLLTEDEGVKVIKWANSGEGYTVPVRTGKSETEKLDNLATEAVELCKILGGSKNENLMKVLKEADKSCNPKKIKDILVLEKLIEDLKNIETIVETTEEKENA